MSNSKKRNYLLILICFLVYVSTYFLKYSYNANIINIKEKFGVSHSEAGLVTTMFFISYGIGQFVNGILARKYNLRICFPIFISISCALNIGVFFTPIDKFYIIKYLWLINGAVLSALWPCVIRMLTSNINEEYKDKAILVIGFVSAAGTSLTYALSSLFTKIENFNLIFIFAAIIGVLFSIVWLLSYDYISIPEGEKALGKKEVVHKEKERVSFYFYTCVIGLLTIVATFTRDGIENWCPKILYDMFNFDKSLSIFITIIGPILQFIGAIIAVELKKVIKSHILLSTISILASILFLGLGWIFSFNEKVTIALAMVAAVLFASTVINITTTILPMVWSKYRNSGFYAGIFNGCAYLGSAISAFGVGYIADTSTWGNVFKLITIILAGSIVISSIYIIISKVLKIKGDEKTETVSENK